jgi:hypothetical protein
MTEPHTFTTTVVPDIGRPGRWRWTVFEYQKTRDKSLWSFSSRSEAQADADQFVAKLDATWAINPQLD